MNRKRNIFGFLSVVMTILILSSGCQNKTAAPVEPAPASKQVTVATQTPPLVPPKETAGVSEPLAEALPPANPNDKVALVSSDSAAKPDESPSGDAKPSAGSKLQPEINSPYTQAKPTLLGLTLKTGLEEIKAKLGKPKDTFMMEDDTDPITVYDYTDFLVGFNKQNQLQFVDIRSADIDPGLNGLKLGDPVSDVTKALGKPDGNTNVVLTYKASGAVLKLDIDPKTQKVNSIKLFGE